MEFCHSYLSVTFVVSVSGLTLSFTYKQDMSVSVLLYLQYKTYT